MKKFLVCLLALTLVAGFAMAQEGLGLTAELEVGAWDMTDTQGAGPLPYLQPGIAYDTALMDGALDLHAEVAFFFGFDKDWTRGEDKFPMDLYFDILAAYNLSLGSASTLSIIVENENNILFAGSDKIGGLLTPGVKFNQNMSFGDLYAQLDLPIGYLEADGRYGSWDLNRGPDLAIASELHLGWKSTFGLGLELGGRFAISPDAEYDGFDFKAYYETGAIYGEVLVEVAEDMSQDGIKITPEFRFAMAPLGFYANCKFGGVASDGDISIAPAVGVTYSF